MSTEFLMPDVIHHDRICGDCGDRWRIECAFGATEPPRNPYYRCPECRAPMPTASPDRLAVDEARRAQLSLVRDDG